MPIKEDDFNYSLEDYRIYDISKIYENKENASIIDARSEERYEGKVQEPRKSLRIGHIKGALNLFDANFISQRSS